MKKFSHSIKKSNEETVTEKNIVDKKQLQWFLGLVKEAKSLDALIEDIDLMIKLSK